jgi:lipid A 4'-phosphatase
VVLAVLVLFSIVVRALDLDLRVARHFHRSGASPAWAGNGSAFWNFVYRFGPWPADIVGGGALIGFIVTFFRPSLRRHRRSLLLLATVLAVGSGLLVNVTLKQHWGRPRPRDCVEFGGTRPFLPVGQPGGSRAGEGFPSGHAANGFYFLSLYVLWRGRRPRAAALGLLAGLVMGSILSMQRMLVGAHFLSDCVWSAGIVVLTALAADRIYRSKLE